MGKLTRPLAPLLMLVASCGSNNDAPSSDVYGNGGAGSGPDAASSGSSSGGLGRAGSTPDAGVGAPVNVAADSGSVGDDARSASAEDAGSTDEDAATGSDSAETNDHDTGIEGEASTTCETGQVQPSEVVMLGDSYLDPSFGNVGPTLMTLANAMYRPYYLGGASMNGGSGQFNIPYQFDSMAVPANADIKVVIMDGGGNDILLNNRQCLSTPVMGDTSCHMVIATVEAEAQKLLAHAASKGVKHVVYFFYPHIDTTTIYSGPDANDWLDYAYPLAAQTCCGSGAPTSGADLSCHGSPVPGVDCTFVDTRPEFVGHNDPTMASQYWLDGFGIHPNKQGAQVLATKVWQKMQQYCIAQ